MCYRLVALLLAAIPVVVIPGVLSTFEPIKTTLTGALGLFAVALAVAAHLSTGTLSFAAMAEAVVGIRMVRGVRGVATWSLVIIAGISILGSISSVASDTSWFGSLGRGQGTLFLITVAAVVALAGPAIATAGGVGTVLRALAIGAVPCALATILQRYGIDPVTGTPCDVDRLQTTIGNALPGSTYFGITTLVALEHLRLAWARWRPPANGGNLARESVAAVTASAEAPPLQERFQSNRALAGWSGAEDDRS